MSHNEWDFNNAAQRPSAANSKWRFRILSKFPETLARSPSYNRSDRSGPISDADHANRTDFASSAGSDQDNDRALSEQRH